MTIGYSVTLVSRTMRANPALPPLFAEVCNILPTQLSWSQRLFEPGMVEVTTQVSALDPVGKTRLLDLTAQPCELWLYRTDTSLGTTVKVHAGPVTAWRIQQRSITITSPDLLYYCAYMRYPFTYGDYTADLSLHCDLLLQTGSSGIDHNFGVQFWGALTGITTTVTYSATEPVPVLEAMQTLGRRSPGFDLWADPTTRQILLASPQRGTDLSSTIVLDQRSIGLADISVSVAANQFANTLIAVSSTASNGTLTSTQYTTGTTITTFGQALFSYQPDNIGDQTALDNAATAVVRDMSTAQFTLNPEILPVYGLDPVSIGPGDTIGYSYDAGLGFQNLTVRVSTIDTTWDGRERMALGFV